MVFPRVEVDAILGRINVDDDEHEVHRIRYLLYHSYLSVKKQAKARAACHRQAKLLKAAKIRSRERVDQTLEDMFRGLGIQDEVGAAIIRVCSAKYDPEIG